MASNSNFPGPLGNIVWGIIGGGDNTDSPQDHSGNQRFYSPVDHSAEGVPLEDLPFAARNIDASQFAQQSFGGALDPGTPVLFMKSLGNPGGVILGQLNSLFTGQSGGGGILSGNKHFQELKDRKLNISAPPKVQETTEDDVKIRKIKETGEMHHLGILEGLPLNGALFNMSGFRLPELKKIPTAKQKNDKMMTMDQMQQMMGQIMSLGQMFQGLMGNKGSGGGGGGLPNGFSSGNPTGQVYTYNPNTSTSVTGSVSFLDSNTEMSGSSSQYYSANNRLISIQDRVPSEMSLAIGNLARIIQGLEVSDGVSFFTGGIVHEDTYLQNAENLLCECKTIDDLMNVLSRLQHDEELFGREHLQDVYVTIDTSYGPTESVLDWHGNIYVQYSNTVLEEMNTFSNTFSSNTDSPAVGSVSYLWDRYDANNANTIPPAGTPGGNPNPSQGNQGGGGGGGGGMNVGGMMGMFSRSAKTMQDMMKRLHPEGEKTARELHKKVNQDQKFKKKTDINNATLNKGDPLKKDHYEG